PDKITDDPDKITDAPDENINEIDEVDVYLIKTDDVKVDNESLEDSDKSSYGDAYDNLEDFYIYMAYKEMKDELDMFVSEFPSIKQEAENYIQHLYSKADRFDKIHNNCSIIIFLVCCIGAFSSIMTVLGITLSPVSREISTVVSFTGMGIAAAVTALGIFAGIIDYWADLQEREFFSEVEENINVDVPEEDIPEEVPNLFSRLVKYSNISKELENRCNVFLVGRTNSSFIEVPHNLMTGAHISSINNKKISQAVQGKTLSLTKGAKIMGATLSGAFIQVSCRANAAITEKLRDYAQALEKKLQPLSNLFEKLKKFKSQ
ncbi:apolipoprotein L3-like, partial [Gracilinanus agilis]|uniref:apolipoprotein L3-like n=1 Tax=Gracilinanus agilis TaxID=191870 RepID=UPI001CFCB30A